MDVVSLREIQGTQGQALVEQSHHDLVVGLQLLHQVQAGLVSWFIVLGDLRRSLWLLLTCSKVLSGSQINQQSSKLYILVQHMILEEHLECRVVFIVKHKLYEHVLQGCLLRDAVLNQRVEEFHDYRGHVFGLLSLC